MTAYLDVIFFAVIAGILLWRLRGVLGERTEGDANSTYQGLGTSSQKSIEANVEAALAAMPSNVIAQSPVNWSANLPNYDIVETATVHHRLIPFLAVDPTFYPDDFIQKARKAFPAIVQAFSKGEKPLLKTLLSPGLYDVFAAEIDRRQKNNEVYDAQVKDVKKALITDADLDGTTATVTVDFTAEQTVLRKDGQGAVIGKDDGHIEKTKDRWVFSKDLKSSDPTWTLVRTVEID